MNIRSLTTAVGIVWQLVCFSVQILGNFASPTTMVPSTLQPSKTLSASQTIDHTRNVQNSVDTKSIKKRCPDNLSVCWKYNPPYIDRNHSGIFPEFLTHMVSTCCQNTTSLEYRIEAEDENGLQACVKNESTNFVLPLTRARSYQVINFIESPGMTLVLNKKAIEATAQMTVWNTLTEAWPLLVLTVLLAAIAGILIWALDSAWNSGQFPVPFSKGALEGFWWAFVTMTTVGYGDRSPKFLLGRLFAISWMILGLAIISLMTASITTTLTTENMEKYSSILNKKIGIIEKSKAENEAMKMGAKERKAYKTVEELYQALEDEEIQGILLDLFIASYAQTNIAKNDGNFIMAKFFEYSYWNVVWARKPFGESIDLDQEANTFACFDRILQIKRDNDVYVVVQKYIQGRSLERLKEGRDSTLQLNMFSSKTIVFRTGLIALSIILGVLILIGILTEIVYRVKKKKNTQNYTLDGNLEKRGGSLNVSAMDLTRMMHKLNDIDKAISNLKEIRDIYKQVKENTTRKQENHTNGSVATFDNPTYS